MSVQPLFEFSAVAGAVGESVALAERAVDSAAGYAKDAVAGPCTQGDAEVLVAGRGAGVAVGIGAGISSSHASAVADSQAQRS